MFDVVVVGAGPAGSTTARYASRRGLRVLMLDKRREIGYPVQCGEFMPANEELKAMFPRFGDADELFNVPESLVSLRTEILKMYSPGGREYRIGFRGYTVDRRRFDKHLVELALNEGVKLETGTVVKRVSKNEVVTGKGVISARIVVGADGPMSMVAECTGMPRNDVLAPALTCHVRGEFEPAVKIFFGHVAPGGYAWIIPKRDSANVGLGVQRRFTGENLRTLFDRFMGSMGLRGEDVAAGYVPVSGPLETTVKGSAILVGDAAGHVMASNGGGIPTGMICGMIAGNIIGDHLTLGRTLGDYEGAWRTAIGEELENSSTTKRMADKVFWNDPWLSVAMRCLGRTGLARAIRCQRVFPW